MQRRTYIGLASLALTSACSFDIRGGGNPPGDSMGADTNLGDAAPICPWPYIPEYATPCPHKTGPELHLMTGKTVLNTDDGTLVNDLVSIDMESEITGDVRVVWTTGLHIEAGARLRVIGSLPVVFIATGAITIDGTLDGAGHADSPLIGDNPAGGNPPECEDMDSRARPGQPCEAEGASGGGGGSFAEMGTQGGGGGDTRSCGAAGAGPIPGGSGGAIVATRPPNLRGGCPGGIGGLSTRGGAVAGRAGSGGGAIALIARDALTIAGTVNVGGAGGGGSAERSGGGGGGSGGMVVLEASIVVVTATGRVAANGGGGGGGSDGNASGEGEDGENNGDEANGGPREGMGTNGGDGGARGTAPTAPAISTRGGGGGGGGVGYLRVRSATPAQADPSVSFSPLPSN